MIINGRKFNFGRCIKIRLKNNLTGKTLEIEHKPEIDEKYYVAMDVVVKDMPAAKDKSNPGFQGAVTIYNPSRELLTFVNSGATWFADYTSSDSVYSPNAMENYYASRIRATVMAGYTSNDGKAEPLYTTILFGYVNGSSFYHKGTDDVLTLGIFDIDALGAATNMIMGAPQDSDTYFNENQNRFAVTWHESFVKYVRLYETSRVSTPEDGESIIPKFSPKQQASMTLTPENQETCFVSDSIPVSDFDRTNTTWFRVYYVKSRQAWDEWYMSGVRDSYGVIGSSVADHELSDELRNLRMPQNKGVSGENLYQVLDALCAEHGNLGWDRIVEDVSKNTYLVYRLGNKATFVPGEQANVRIWNYQNLLESPSVDGSGSLTIKMMFNPACKCNRTIALMLTDKLKETDTTRNVAGLNTSIQQAGGFMGSMYSQTSGASFAVNQLGGNQNIASVRKATNDWYKRGYMFNTGMPMIRVEHQLSTYKGDWTTTVKTVPIISGMNYEVKGK